MRCYNNKKHTDSSLPSYTATEFLSEIKDNFNLAARGLS